MNPEIKSILQKPITPENAEKLATLVDKAGGFAQLNEYMNKLANNAYVKMGKVKCNNKHLHLIIRGMLLSNWQKYLEPT